ncbi:UDP-glucosyltransferase 2-like [Musca vetustissima]|uniref:UDP-glucosyltransferase 2-like n=1 Tax=Musca vetustissima TaxID=27455 RepID=UPI002AB6CD2B|nr:UDP-glucosyltransferase 2-like [Musca vetustissima]
MKSDTIVVVSILLISTTFPSFGDGAKILSIFGYPGPSQYFFISPLLKGLAKRGHEVVSISTFPQKEPVQNFRDIAVMENSQLFEITDSYFSEFMNLARTGETMVTNILENPEVKNVLAEEKFDLLIVEIFFSEALLGLGEYFKAPVITVSTFGTVNFMDYLVQNPSPLSYVPHLAMPYGDHMSLLERMHNVIMQTLDDLNFNYCMMPLQEELYRKYFPQATLTLDEARKNVSLVLLNDHFSLRSARPYVPNMIEVGGLHIKRQPDPLPQDLQELLDKSGQDVIYFSLGSNVKSKDLSKEKIKMFLDAFRNLKYTILWKFENDTLPNKPKNVIIRKWYPQPSVLAHPKVKLFISHGGYLSTTETIFHGKPILGIPLLGDQFMNVKNAVNAGYALSLSLEQVTSESLKKTILELLTNPIYTQNVQRRSKQFRDTPLTPLETAIYWVEYVLRHEGAVHMRNAGVDLNFFQYHNIDVYLILLTALVAIVKLLIVFVRLGKHLFVDADHNDGKSRKAKIN